MVILSPGKRITDHVVPSALAQQSAEGDVVGQGGQEDEEHGRQALDVKGVLEVTQVERRFAPDVLHQPGERTAHQVLFV